ncbi:permease for cytosine/purines, uracil, thiamine, allantoin-domain-containing protein [Aspergillus flavus]|uniref:Permease for cytosine/purines, uracil, thiamine, allantoin-domain-containing protein n=1 Tax=Aspergillus flavus (strain ATCC 200026 / FGSC A1120 / IAM 13836 / NRRL 3357 / JCM 12722 / SRRC 167) TaxID=332952 RepID=A0A7U2QXS6_ASPFN|nr:permease for cytosine/purines, uracil, thiamine, allantoin-domain-containing protein [Aspergillus flavus]
MGSNVPANALVGAATFPRYINLRCGAYITVLVSIACNPWKLVNTASTFLAVISSHSIFLGPMVVSMLASYFAGMRRKIKVEDLFPCHADGKGIYWYTYGVNWRAPVTVSLSQFLGCVLVKLTTVALWNGSFTLWVRGLCRSQRGSSRGVDADLRSTEYYICFLTGTAISAGMYTALHYIFPTPEVRAFVEKAPSPGILMQEYRLPGDQREEIVEQVKP